MINKLTKEIAKRVILDSGAGVPKLFGRAGLTEKVLKTEKKINITYHDDSTNIHDVYAGKLNVNPELQALLIDLSSDSEAPEYLVILKTQDNKYIAVKAIFPSEKEQEELLVDVDEEDSWYIRSYYMPDGIWKETSVLQKAHLLVLFEQVVDVGALWVPLEEENIDALFKAALKLLGGADVHV